MFTMPAMPRSSPMSVVVGASVFIEHCRTNWHYEFNKVSAGKVFGLAVGASAMGSISPRLCPPEDRLPNIPASPPLVLMQECGHLQESRANQCQSLAGGTVPMFIAETSPTCRRRYELGKIGSDSYRILSAGRIDLRVS